LYTWAPGTCIPRAAESFYGKFRDEWLSLKWRRAEAKGCDRKMAQSSGLPVSRSAALGDSDALIAQQRPARQQ
jgi:hypothetical protein